jgi:hypothetical protein
MSGNDSFKIIQLEELLKTSLKPVSPRPEFINDLRYHLENPDPATLEDLNFFRIISMSLTSLFFLVILLATGFGLIKSLQKRSAQKNNN